MGLQQGQGSLVKGQIINTLGFVSHIQVINFCVFFISFYNTLKVKKNIFSLRPIQKQDTGWIWPVSNVLLTPGLEDTNFKKMTKKRKVAFTGKESRHMLSA